MKPVVKLVHLVKVWLTHLPCFGGAGGQIDEQSEISCKVLHNVSMIHFPIKFSISIIIVLLIFINFFFYKLYVFVTLKNKIKLFENEEKFNQNKKINWSNVYKLDHFKINENRQHVVSVNPLF